MRRMRRFTGATVVAMLALTNVVGAASAQDGPTAELAETIDYVSQIEALVDMAADARLEILADIEQIDEWLADDDTIVLYPGTAAAEAVSLEELARDILVGELVAPAGLSLRQIRDLVFVLDITSERRIVDDLRAALDAGERDSIRSVLDGSKFRSDLGLRGWRARLEQELEDIDELESLIEAELQRLIALDSSGTGSGGSGDSASTLDSGYLDIDAIADDAGTLEGSVDVGGPYSSCNWRTGWPQHGPLATMRVFAWIPTDEDADESPKQFRYSVAWEPSRNDMKARQEDEIRDLRARGLADVIFVGGPNGFCRYVESTCPGQSTQLCDRVADEAP